jgi:serine/threonine-protein kinase
VARVIIYEAGDVIDCKYELIRLLGEGGMGMVFEAVHITTRGRVALKLLLPHLGDKEDLRSRFEREAKAGASLIHSNIVGVTDYGKTPDNCLYLCMKFVEGRNLDEWAREHGGRLPLLVLIAVALKVCEALKFAHAQGVVHRDLKPENVMIASVGEVLLCDLGVAKLVNPGNTPTSHVLVGTPLYIAPETWRGDAAKPGIDLFALGVIMYELISGRRPFIGSDMAEVSRQILTVEPPHLTAIAPHVPKPIARVVHRLLEKDPARRYQTAKQVQDDLRRTPEGRDALLLDLPAYVAGEGPALPLPPLEPVESAPITVPATVASARGEVAVPIAGPEDRTRKAQAISLEDAMPPRRRRRRVLTGAAAVLALGLGGLGALYAPGPGREAAEAIVPATAPAEAPTTPAVSETPVKPSAPEPLLVEPVQTPSPDAQGAVSDAGVPAADAAPPDATPESVPDPVKPSRRDRSHHRSRASQPPGELVVTARTWANIWVSGLGDVGTAPLRYPLKPGRYTVILSSDVDKKKFTVEIHSGESSKINAPW